VDVVEADEGVALCEDLEAGDVEAARFKLDRAARPSTLLAVRGGRNGNTALLCASEAGHVEAVRFMLDHPGADAAVMLVQVNEFDKTALMRWVTFLSPHSQLERLRPPSVHAS
jgi:ankyrin repeat protein